MLKEPNDPRIPSKPIIDLLEIATSGWDGAGLWRLPSGTEWPRASPIGSRFPTNGVDNGVDGVLNRGNANPREGGVELLALRGVCAEGGGVVWDPGDTITGRNKPVLDSLPSELSSDIREHKFSLGGRALSMLVRGDPTCGSALLALLHSRDKNMAVLPEPVATYFSNESRQSWQWRLKHIHATLVS